MKHNYCLCLLIFSAFCFDLSNTIGMNKEEDDATISDNDKICLINKSLENLHYYAVLPFKEKSTLFALQEGNCSKNETISLYCYKKDNSFMQWSIVLYALKNKRRDLEKQFKLSEPKKYEIVKKQSTLLLKKQN